MIATLATRADEAGVKTTVVSTDRDAFQLVSENIALMMTPRGVADVQVYTPERVLARYGIGPELIPDFIGLKGDTSDNIPGVPGIGDKTAGQLLAQYGSLEAVLEHTAELSPARRKNLEEHADQARASKVLATMRRDLELDADPSALVLSPPDRSQLKEIFRRFEFRNLLGRIDVIDEALPAAEAVRWRASRFPGGRSSSRRPCDGEIALAAEDGRAALALPDGSVALVPAPVDLGDGARVTVHDAKAARIEATDDTLLLAYLIEPGRATYALDDLAAEYGVELQPEPATDEETAALVSHAAATLRLAGADARPGRRAGHGAALPRHRAAAHPRARGHGGRRREDRHLPHGRDHRPARRPRRGARGTGATSLPVRSSCSARRSRSPASSSSSSASPPGRKGKTGYSTDAKVLRTIRDEHEIVPVIEEWREYSKLLNTYLGPLPSLISAGGRTAAHDLQPGGRVDRASLDHQPEPPVDPDPHRAREGDSQRVHRRARPPARLGRLLPGRAADPRARLRRAEAPRGVRARGGRARGDGVGGARDSAGRADEGSAQRGQDGQLRDHLRHLVLRALREPRDPARGGADLHRHVPGPLPARAGLHRAHRGAGDARRLRDDALRPAPPDPGAEGAEPPDARRSANGWP